MIRRTAKRRQVDHVKSKRWFLSAAARQQSITAVTNIYIYFLEYHTVDSVDCPPFISLFSSGLCKNYYSVRVSQPAGSHRDKDVQVETVVGLPEEKDEDQAEETGAGETPVQPGQLCRERRGGERGSG